MIKYWNFPKRNYIMSGKDNKSVLKNGGNLYCVSLDNNKAKEFFDQKGKKVFDLTRYNDKSVLVGITQVELRKNKDAYLILNLQCISNRPDIIYKLIDLIGHCADNNKRVFMTGSTTLRKLIDEIKSLNESDPKIICAFSEAMSFFNTIIFPLDFGYVKSNDKNKALSIYSRKISDEIEFGHQKDKLTDLLNLKDLKAREEYEKTLLEIQEFNSGYYLNIWHELTFKEKQMVYNFAKEGFVNYSNIHVMTDLLQKGVFRLNDAKDRIILFSRSFRNFASVVPSEELRKEFETDRKQNGNVNNLRNALLAFLFLVIFLISMYDPGLFNKYIGMVSGSLAVISSLASLFAGKTNWSFPSFGKN